MRSPGPTFDLRAALSAEVRAALDALSDGDMSDPKTVHRARVHLKRARALARVGRIGAPGLAEVFNDSARSCMHALAPARDANALAQAARQAAKKEGKKASRALAQAAQHLEMVRPMLDAESILVSLRDLLALAQVWPEASSRQIRRGAKRVAARAKHARKLAVGATDVELRHDWRKREKERFYVADILADAWPRKSKRSTAQRLAAALGRERDARLLTERLRELAANDNGGVKCAVRALKRRGKKFAHRADRLGRKLKGA